MGLTELEAAERLKAQGRNVLSEGKKSSPIRIFAGQFKDVMVMILLAATAVSVLLGEVADAVTIILNARGRLCAFDLCLAERTSCFY